LSARFGYFDEALDLLQAGAAVVEGQVETILGRTRTNRNAGQMLVIDFGHSSNKQNEKNNLHY
jgi:hypothetical protein